MRQILLAILFVLSFTGNARADPNVIGDQCWAKPVFALTGISKILFGSSGESGNDTSYTLLGVSFTNSGNVALTDIKVHYEFTDAFGAKLDELDGVWSGSFAPGVMITFIPPGRGVLKERELFNADHVKSIHCTITGARWADGTILNEPVQVPQ